MDKRDNCSWFCNSIHDSPLLRRSRNGFPVPLVKNKDNHSNGSKKTRDDTKGEAWDNSNQWVGQYAKEGDTDEKSTKGIFELDNSNSFKNIDNKNSDNNAD